MGFSPKFDWWHKEYWLDIACFIIGGSRGARDACPPPPLFAKIYWFPCSFRKKWLNSRLTPPPLGLTPPLGNPGSAAGYVIILMSCLMILHFSVNYTKTNHPINLETSAVFPIQTNRRQQCSTSAWSVISYDNMASINSGKFKGKQSFTHITNLDKLR